MREDRKAEFQRAIEENQKRLAEFNGPLDSDDAGDAADQGSDEEWEGFAEPPAVDYEAEYIDENKYTTVTVEDMDPSKEGLYKAAQDEDDGSEKGEGEQEGGASKPANADATKPAKKQAWNKNDRDQANKKKKKKFRYESPAERKAGRIKERMSNRKQAKARRTA